MGLTLIIEETVYESLVDFISEGFELSFDLFFISLFLLVSIIFRLRQGVCDLYRNDREPGEVQEGREGRDLRN